MKIRTTASEKTVADYDQIMGSHHVPLPYATDGDCFRDNVEAELEDNPRFILTADWLLGEMRDLVKQDADMIREAAIYDEPGLPAWRKDHAAFRRQFAAFGKRLESCRVRTIEI